MFACCESRPCPLAVRQARHRIKIMGTAAATSVTAAPHRTITAAGSATNNGSSPGRGNTTRAANGGPITGPP
jgi:hypothetical protein